MFPKEESQKIDLGSLYNFFLTGIIAILLTACTTPIVAVIESPTNIPTQTHRVETSTPLPTWTPRPTNTIAPTPTLDNISALASEFDISNLCLFNYLISRDQNWIGADCKLSKEFVITGKSNKSKITIRYQELYDGDLTNFSVRPLSWSRDNRYLYFTTRCCNYDDTYNGNGSLFQYNMERKNWSTLVHAVDEPYYFFSEDGERYIYFNQFPEFTIEIGMTEISAKRNKRVVLKWYQLYGVGKDAYKWSKSGGKFVIILNKITTINTSIVEQFINTEEVLLRIDFTKMKMELVEEFNRNNLIGEE